MTEPIPITEQSVTAEGTTESLRRDALRTLAVITFALGCAWVLYVAVLMNDTRPLSGLAPLGLLLVSGVTFWLPRRSLSLVSAFFPIGLLLVLLLYVLQTSGSLAPFFAPLIIFVSSVTCSRRVMVGLGLGTGAAFVAISWLQLGRPSPAADLAAVLCLLAVVAAWVATRNTYIALEWATQSHLQAAESMAALRERRAELRGLADMLRHNQERLHYLNIHLEQAKVAAEEAYRTKQHFVANVSHELRTPLNLITGFSEMIAFSPESYAGVRLPPQYQEDVMEIHRSSKHLLGLVEDVLALAQLEAGQLIVQREPGDLAQVVQEAVETIRPLFEAKGLSLDIILPTELPTMLIDAGRIRQVLLNLFNNAQRFTEQGGVAVQVSYAGHEATIEVRDSGVGIAPEDLPRIFEEFHSLNKGPAARRGGFGLGLSISRRLIEAHGGRLRAESDPGRGSRFYVALPITMGEREALRRPILVQTTPRASAESSKPVLLALSEECPVFERHLGDYRVLYAHPEQAVEAYEQYLPMAIWINDQACATNISPDLLPILRVAPTLPLISCRIPTDVDLARRLRADAFLSKPITREKIARTLDRLTLDSPIARILIIDDDLGILQLIERFLSSLVDHSCKVVKACGGKEGLELLHNEPPDLVLLDLVMPEVSGYDILADLHSRPEYVNARVVLMSGVETDENATRVYTISVQCQSGFSLPKSLNMLKMLAGELSKVPEIQAAQSG